ncbi:MAG: aminotransferase class III-fold pyridoxal phosphate-dependent enzyme, partial [Candidatus Caldarchaeum sp.]
MTKQQSAKTAYYLEKVRKHLPKSFWNPDSIVADLIIERAEGAFLYDVDGNKYVDLTSQWSTNNIGNVDKEVLDAAIEGLRQYGFLIYSLNLHKAMFELIEELISISPSKNLTRVALELSGTGAVDAAVKFAVKVKKRPHIISFLGQYHGYYTGTLGYGPEGADARSYFE